MINVGTVGAYLTLSTADFHNGIASALGDLSGLEGRIRGTPSVFAILKGAFLNVITAAVSPYAAALRGAQGQTGVFSSSASSALGGFASAAASAIAGTGRSVGSLTGVFSSARAGVASQARSMASAVVSPLYPLGTTAHRLMQNVGSGMLSGLASRSGAIIARARAIADSVSRVIRSALRISSPSKVTRELGRQTGLGFELGLADSERGVMTEAGRLAGSGFSTAARSLTPSRPSVSRAEERFSSSERLEKQLDRIARAVENADRVMQLDGRTFARLVREYS